MTYGTTMSAPHRRSRPAAGRRRPDQVAGDDIVLHGAFPSHDRHQILERSLLGERRTRAAREQGKDNQNWIAVMDAYGGNALRDSFSQAGYIAARIAVAPC